MIPPFAASRALRAFLFAPVLAVLAPAAHAAEAGARWATLEAIHNLENPYDRSTPGRYGELGPYQFRETTWRQYSHEPFAHALNRCSSDQVAIACYERLKSVLVQHGLRPTAYNIALAWNGGIGAALNGHPSHAARDYAERASNLAADYQHGTVAAQ
ncbi:MAG TPA: hypothetical protein VHV47_01785 [Opitutaceae bacterium]|nr:hypothetical protein [Opitutaceae bacterium]